MNILDKIINDKKIEVEERSRITPIERIKDAQRLYSIRDFNGKLKNKGLQIIAEIKRRSPSEGDINIHADPTKIAKSYAKNGAACISILTDHQYFGGQLEFIQLVKAVVDIPILRKDFIIDEYQIWESRAAGADAILLIADILSEGQLVDYLILSQSLGMTALIESHNIGDLLTAQQYTGFPHFMPEIVTFTGPLPNTSKNGHTLMFCCYIVDYVTV